MIDSPFLRVAKEQNFLDDCSRDILVSQSVTEGVLGFSECPGGAYPSLIIASATKHQENTDVIWVNGVHAIKVLRECCERLLAEHKEMAEKD